MVDGGRLGRQRHIVHGLFEVDVTWPRQAIREHKERTGESLSFTAFVIACLGPAVDMNKYMHAYRDWRDQLVLFEEVDVNTLFKEYMGTVLMTGIGMFASGGFWGIPVPNHTLQVTLGGIEEKPGTDWPVPWCKTSPMFGLKCWMQGIWWARNYRSRSTLSSASFLRYWDP